MNFLFKDRKEAALALAKALQSYTYTHPLVLGVPRGGVEIAWHLARELHGDLSVAVSRKLGHPRHPEAAFGALAEDGSLYLDPWTRKLLTKELIEGVIAKEEKEIRRRVDLYRGDRPLPELGGRTVILADDGIATGATLFALIEMCRKRGAGTIVVAAPVSAPHAFERLTDHADEVVVLHIPSDFFAVSGYYEHFPEVSDKRVLSILENRRQTQAG